MNTHSTHHLLTINGDEATRIAIESGKKRMVPLLKLLHPGVDVPQVDAKNQRDLTQEQKNLVDEIADYYGKNVLSYQEESIESLIDWMDTLYKLYGKSGIPRREDGTLWIEIFDSPHAALRRAEKLLTDESTPSTDWNGIDDAGWTAYFDLCAAFGIVGSDSEEMKRIYKLREFTFHWWDTIALDGALIAIRRPKVIRHDANYNLHSTTAPAIEWGDGEHDYVVNGSWVPDRIVKDPRSFTPKEFENITNTEQRRALLECAGLEWALDNLLGGKVISEWQDANTGLSYALYGADGRLVGANRSGVKFLRKQSPPLKDGSQPIYVEQVHEDLKTAQAARKWQVIPGLTPEAAESNPVLNYLWEA